ncbi:MAG: DUF4199 domain-containing protein [Phormidesmis sp. FL-bin-119]|nr:DUF4199 domain-containing protein [Pedobacter sp.]
MKRIVLVFGSVSGLLIGLWTMASMAYLYNTNNYEGSMLLGYTAMLLALSLVYVGVKSYRDKENGGIITFGKAFQLALLISLLASTIYVIAWTTEYYLFMPDFMEKFSAQYLQKAQNSGVSAAELSAKAAEINSMKELYKNPLMVVLFTYLEILPVGLIVSLISALLLKRKGPVETLVSAV